MAQDGSSSKKQILTGRILSGVIGALLTLDAVMKIVRESHSVQGTIEAGYPDAAVMWIGLSLLLGIILYAIPRTAVLGAVVLTGYLGGAVATNVRTQPLGFLLLPIVVGAIVWGGLWFRDARVRALMPLVK
ncbi:MAG: DoxX family protein [Acidobacteriota bacterium]